MPNIGGINVMFGADASGFNREVDSTQKRFAQFSQAVSRTGAGTKIGTLGSVASAPFKVMAGGAALAMAGVKTTFAGMGGAVRFLSDPLHGVENVFRSFTNPVLDPNGEFKKIAQIARDSDRLGISTESLITLQHAAGGSAEMLVPAMVKMSRAISQTDSVAEAASKPLEHFGVNINELAKMAPDAALKTLADRYEQLTPGIDRAAFATAFLGRSGLELDPLLRRIAGGGLTEVGAKVKELQLLFSRKEAFGVMEAIKSAKEMNAIFEGMKRQATIAVAPLVAAIGTSINDWLKEVDLRVVFIDVVDFLAKSFDYIRDTFGDLKTIAGGIASTFKEIHFLTSNAPDIIDEAFGGGALERMGFLKPKEDKGLPAIPKGTKFPRRVNEDGSLVEDGGKWEGGTGGRGGAKAGKGWWQDFVAEMRRGKTPELGSKESLDLAAKEATKAADMASLALHRHHEEVLSSTADSIALWQATTSGASYSQIEVLKVREATKAFASQLEELRQKGATQKDIAPVLQWQAAIRATMLEANMAKEATSIWQSVQQPVENYATELRKLQDVLMSGKLDWETYRRAVEKSVITLDDASNARGAWSAGEALSKGSAGAISAINREKFGDSVQQRTETVLKQTRDYVMQMLQQLMKADGDNKTQIDLLNKILNPGNKIK